MRPAAPSLDVIAAQAGAAAGRRRSGDDSRSSSSTNSPVPADHEESDFFLGANDSQSSLGVPNLQDMQVSDDLAAADDACLPAVYRLPSEILISIFARLNSTADLFRCMMTCKRWAKNCVDLLWHRPACSNWRNHESICQTLRLEHPYFSYRDFIKRLNLAALAENVNDGSVIPLAVCTRVERLTLTNCRQLTDGGLTALLEGSSSLLALDVSGLEHISERSVLAIARNCRRLQGLNISGCRNISNESLVKLAESCRYIKRLKLNDCTQLQDSAILAFAEHCPNILEIDLHMCRDIGNEPVTALLARGHSLRELRLVSCEFIDDGAFLSLPLNKTYEHLRILDMTSCARLTDRAVERIIDAAPRLRNLVLAKCRNITDVAVQAIAKLGKNLHYVHLGHCGHITDEAVKRLVHACNRIRYIDLGCCTNLTDDSVTRLATLPKLKRIGLVKCSNITDESVFALARANHRPRARKDEHGNVLECYASSLERVHLSYCTSLTLKSIIQLLNFCEKLTHLSLTGVSAFLREEFADFCRPPPNEFTEHQRSVFCVFSGNGVLRLRDYLNSAPEYAEYVRVPRDSRRSRRHLPPLPHMAASAGAMIGGLPSHGLGQLVPDGEFDDPDVVDDDDAVDGLDNGEMSIDTHPLLPPAPPPMFHQLQHQHLHLHPQASVAGSSAIAPMSPDDTPMLGVGMGNPGSYAANPQPFQLPPFLQPAWPGASAAPGPPPGQGASAAGLGVHVHGHLVQPGASTAPVVAPRDSPPPSGTPDSEAS